jgi:hypothetical protein
MKNFYVRIAAAMLISTAVLALCWFVLKFCPLVITAFGVWLLAVLAACAMLLIYAWALDQPLNDWVFDHVND